MAFGLSPKFEQELDLNGLDSQQYIVTALESAKELDWEIEYTSKSGFTAFKKKLWSYVFELKLVATNEKVYISSTSLGRGMYDWGKNKKNVEAIIAGAENILANSTDEQLNEKVAELSAVFNSEEKDKLEAGQLTGAGGFKGFLSLFIPHTGYFITPNYYIHQPAGFYNDAYVGRRYYDARQ